jgi:hypothetical protein
MKMMEMLRAEIAEVDQELALLGGRAHAALTDDFFWENVFPLLFGARELTSQQLRSELKRRDLVVNDGSFRVFLSRARSRGLLAMNEMKKGWPRWSLTDQAFAEAKKRIDRGS